jgi:outer membrane protein
MYKKVSLLAALLALATTASAEPLSLKDCLVKASAANNGLKAASYEVRMAKEQVGIAKSGMLPQVDAQGGYVAQQAAQAVQFGPIIAETQDADYPYFNLAIYQTLYDFGRTKARVGAAQMQQEAAAHTYSGTEQELFLQVVRSYYGILEAQKIVTAAKDEVVQMTSHQDTAQALFDQGVVTRNDLLQAQVRVASSKQKLYSAVNAVENGWLQLNYLTGQPADFRSDLEEVLSAPTPLQESQPDLSKRGEIEALKDVVTAGDYSVREAKSNYYPEFFVKLGLDYLENSKVREQTIMSATVGFKVNLFDGLATSSRLRQAVEQRSRDRERLRDLEERVRLELATAQNDLRVASARIKVAEQAIRQGIENLRINKDRYQEKVGTATDVIDAQTLLTQTRTDYYQSVFDLEIASARVKRALGQL